VNRLPIVPVLAVLLTGCSLATDRDVRAYNACLARHLQDVVLCEGPRQAYEIDSSTFQTRSAPIRPTARYGYAEALTIPAPLLTPVTVRPASMPITFGLNGHDPCVALGLCKPATDPPPGGSTPR
jgi:hypothetical protein